MLNVTVVPVQVVTVLPFVNAGADGNEFTVIATAVRATEVQPVVFVTCA